MKSVSIFCLLIYTLISLEATGQAKTFKTQPTTKMDSIKVKADRFIFINDQAYYARVDTIFVFPDTTDFYIRKNNMERSEEFYNQMEQKMSKSKLSNMMYDYMFVQEDSKPLTEEFHEQRFIPYERETVSSIDFKPMPIFGASVKDTTKYDPSNAMAAVNKIHIHTLDWIIKKNLTFKEGDHVNPTDFVDSERLIRRLRYVKDARIMLNEHSNQKEADVVVVTQDVLPYSFLFSPNNDNNALFGITTINIAGLGHEFEYDYIRDGGSDFFYKIANVRGSFIDAEFNYANHFIRTGYGAFFERDFVTQEMKYAGGASLSRYVYGQYNYEPTTDVTSTYTYDERFSKLWVARAFKTNIKTQILGIDAVTNMVASAGVEYADFFDRPTVTADTNFRYHNKATYLIELGLSARNYYKDRFIIEYGRTEDIPTGSTIGIVAGFQDDEFTDRFYLGFNYARGGYIKNFGYFNGIASLGSFVGANGYENGIVKFGADYFTPLITVNQVKIRQFVDFTYSQSINPDEEYILRSEADIGIRGVRGYYLRATRKFNLKFETVIFTPVNFLEFRMAAFAFFDYTTTQNIRNDFFDVDHFMGVGGGIRLRNDNLAISTFQLRLAYYPSTPINASNSPVSFSNSTHLDIRDFDFRAPQIIPF
ncbi:hypothetical protein N7E81_05345 [Reichenbachiella carrageenanivorans]|uniref:Outer membrane protein assembly factor BamA n=1 Tax=Reichenbachiella carrageenanivorans TaxID=2979869 RepID=A0ABY6D5W2_9BACT|nr:hypothetical protein [Reichenbachiella carrageenanivorans]UXX80523.1 hypothetical protein N7E81_05345 [Reichenbachiella carrageenanivorans]